MTDGFLGIEEPNNITKKIASWIVSVAGLDVHQEIVRLAGSVSGEVVEASTANGLEVDVTRVAAPTGINGGPATIGTTAVELTFTGTTKTISIKAASTNTGLVWFGPATVDNTGANAYGELTADAAVEIEIDDVSAAIYVVSDTAAQKVYKAALT